MMFPEVEYVRLPEVCGCFPSLGNFSITIVGLFHLKKNLRKNMFILYNIAKLSLDVFEKIIRGFLF